MPNLSGQTNQNPDSLFFGKEIHDSVKVRMLLKLSNEAVLSDYQKAMTYMEQSVDLAEKTGNPSLLLKTLRNACRVTYLAHMYDLASEYSLQLQDLALKTGAKNYLADSYFEMGAIWNALSESDKAEEAYLKSYDLYKEYAAEVNDSIPTYFILNFHNNIGIIYLSKGDFQKAAVHFNDGLKIAGTNPEHQELSSNILTNQAIMLITKKEYDSAIRTMRLPLDYFTKKGNQRSVVYVLMNIGDAYNYKGVPDSARYYYSRAFRISNSLGNPELMSLTADRLHWIVKNLNMPDSALYYLTLSQENSRKVDTRKAREAMVRQKITEEFRAKENAERKKRNLSLMLYMAIFISVTGTGILLFFAQRRKLKSISSKALELEEVTRKLNEEHKELINDILSESGRSGELSAHKEIELRLRNFDAEFYSRLNAKYPGLTANERRLCAFLRINMTTKEISGITGQTPRSIEIARARLRRKMGLTGKDTSLIDFLNSL